MRSKLVTLAVFFAAAAAIVQPLTAGAQEFPTKNFSLVVPFPAGGGTDLFARAIGTQLTAQFGRQVIVDNRTGASGNIGAEAVVRSAPDGHTLLYTASPLALSRAVYSKLAFDAARDLTAITMTVSIPQVLVVHPSLPVKNVRELVALSKQKGAELTYSSGGAGSAGHFAMELFKLRTDANMLHIPYRGAAPALTALISGEVQLAFLVPPVVKNHLENGKLRALGVSARKRAAIMPDVPTIEELGVGDFEALQWHGFFVPAKTPEKITDQLHKGIATALKSPEVQKRLASQGAELVGSSPKEFAAFFQAELVKWSDVAKRAKMRLN